MLSPAPVVCYIQWGSPHRRSVCCTLCCSPHLFAVHCTEVGLSTHSQGPMCHGFALTLGTFLHATTTVDTCSVTVRLAVPLRGL